MVDRGVMALVVGLGQPPVQRRDARLMIVRVQSTTQSRVLLKMMMLVKAKVDEEVGYWT